MALHLCERYKLMVLKISSKFELRRFCRITGTSALLKLSQPKADDLRFIDSVSVEEIGGARVAVVRSEEGGIKVVTVVLRGSNDSILDDLERAVDDGVNTYKAMYRDIRMVPGAAATEIELGRRLKEFSFKETGLNQYAIAKFAESFEMVPRYNSRAREFLQLGAAPIYVDTSSHSSDDLADQILEVLNFFGLGAVIC